MSMLHRGNRTASYHGRQIDAFRLANPGRIVKPRMRFVNGIWEARLGPWFSISTWASVAYYEVLSFAIYYGEA